MKLRVILAGMLCACAVFAAKPGFCTLYSFTPSPSDLYDLDHYYYYTWGINFTLKPNEVIDSAQLYIKNINNWAQEDNDKLYVHLLDQANTGVTSFWDNQGGGDNFNSWLTSQILLDTYTDTNDYPGPAENYVYNLDSFEIQTLTAYINNNGLFGLGFDPDCHYWNDGVKFKLNTKVVPEPASVVLFATGAAGAFFRRKRSPKV